MGWLAYLLRCRDGSLYAGITNDVHRRLAAHAAGTASRYTRARRPVTLVWTEPCSDRGSASRREATLKRLPRAAKLALITATSGRRTLDPRRDGKTRRRADPSPAS